MKTYDVQGFEPSLILTDSVVLVGNSPKVLESKNGKLIDSFDTVIRFNGANIAGLEEYVGTRTSYQVLAIDIAFMFGKGFKRPSKEEGQNDAVRKVNARKLLASFPNATFITHNPAGIDMNRPRMERFKVAEILKEQDPSVKVVTFSQNTDSSSLSRFTWANQALRNLGCEESLKYGGPRTGFKTILKLVSSGIKPHLFGFDIDLDTKFARHYHDDVMKADIEKHKDHDLKGELIALQELSDKGFIEVHF